MGDTFSLPQLGWRPFYSQQLTLEDLSASVPARVAGIHRTTVTVIGESGEQQSGLPRNLAGDAGGPRPTVGDWVLIEPAGPRVVRLLGRQSLIARLAAGTGPVRQAIAANVDTLFIVTSCNADFSAARLERYLAITHEAGVTPVIILTKADVCADPQPYAEAALAVAQAVQVLVLNGKDPGASGSALQPWLAEGQTVAFVGSSGVGKSTLTNTVLGTDRQPTREIRQDDGRGRHTTTARCLLSAPGGAWLIDTPGMRELKIGAVESGLRRTFIDIETLAGECRFRDCRHLQEVGCAVRSAVEEGRLPARRLQSYLKLAREADRAAAPPWKRHQEQRSFGRMARAAQKRRRNPE
ncbi:MAG TPA: ribosome small subunit-dependent GTPase A [Steroidobacteraceae bacterium]|nr:ribosome small subunit-dependent GTPase A [Steroidobacteraceae bacterium]